MKPLGEILSETFSLNPEMLAEALTVQGEKGGRLGEILVQQKKITEEQLLQARSFQFGMDIQASLPQKIDPFFVQQVPIGFLKRFKMIPVATPEESYIAVSEPLHFQQIDDLQRVLQWDGIKTVLAPQNEIFIAINSTYDLGSKDAADQVMQDMDEDDPDSILSAIEETADLLDDTSDAPVIKLVNLVLSQAVRDNASDVHIESYKDRVKIRKRVDGILYDMYSPPKHVQGKLISRVKIMAKLDIAEKRLPQDGRIEIRIADKNVDIRVSTMPTAFGERVVMRLLDKTSVLLSLTDVGMLKEDLETFNDLITAANGIILVTGPTGSGKTTTLYSALNKINRPDINIITVEDPIEYQLEGISQMQVNPKIELTFANGLRSIVRQDPDVILIGEIRDLETAEIAIQASLTGHLVFSTLHTNDAASAVTRLVDMGVEPFLVTSSVNAIVAQRLVRKICETCKISYFPDEATLATVGMTSEDLNGQPLYKGTGCPSCLNTGYKGRIGIFEVLLLNDEIRRIILTSSDANQIQNQALADGMISLKGDGVRKIITGKTTVEEVFRVTH